MINAGGAQHLVNDAATVNNEEDAYRDTYIVHPGYIYIYKKAVTALWDCIRLKSPQK